GWTKWPVTRPWYLPARRRAKLAPSGPGTGRAGRSNAVRGASADMAAPSWSAVCTGSRSQDVRRSAWPPVCFRLADASAPRHHRPQAEREGGMHAHADARAGIAGAGPGLWWRPGGDLALLQRPGGVLLGRQLWRHRGRRIYSDGPGLR